MKIAIGADHAGVGLKRHLAEVLKRLGHEVRDFGTWAEDPADYPDIAVPLAVEVAAGICDYGILICATGIGMTIAANKVPGIRAGVGGSVEHVRLMRAHNAANVLGIGARFTASDGAESLVETFLSTPFEGGRHARRVDKIAAAERMEDWREAARP